MDQSTMDVQHLLDLGYLNNFLCIHEDQKPFQIEPLWIPLSSSSYYYWVLSVLVWGNQTPVGYL